MSEEIFSFEGSLAVGKGRLTIPYRCDRPVPGCPRTESLSEELINLSRPC